jgi:hypothetical protein
LAGTPKKRAAKDGASRACEGKPKKTTKNRSAAQLVSDALRVQKHLTSKFTNAQLITALIARCYEAMMRQLVSGKDGYWYAKTLDVLTDIQSKFELGTGPEGETDKGTPAELSHAIRQLFPRAAEGGKA